MNKKRQAIWNKSGGRCWYCGCDLPEKGWHADHFEPIMRNPPKVEVEYGRDENGRMNKTRIETPRPPSHPERDVESNKVPCCASCNIQKGASSLEGFRRQIEQFVNSLNQYTNQYKFAKRYGLVQESGQPVVFWFERQKRGDGQNERD